MQKKILIADDHYVVRMGASLLLHSAYENLEIDFTENFPDTKFKISNGNYDLVMLDIDMPGSIKTEMISELKSSDPNIKILIFSAYNEKTAVQYINKGADGYLNKQQSEKVVDAVTSIFEKGYYYSPEMTHYIVSNNNEINAADKLSNRELEIFRLLAEGNGNLEISNSLNIKMSTVSTFKKRIFEKLKVKTVVEMIKLYEK
ncbi:response regulator transcription factor [Chryseobacterium sp.]|uniref:response regulator transcription factor n=1 Tax=Chryseobacterium sp. TaxID=1871047 RepID=UPI00289D9A10|nr:response regulator transcription factor [Chryseobacterium sp.]